MSDMVTTEDFNSLVIEAEGSVLVDFSATWCGPCSMVAPLLNEIATEQAGNIKIYTLDIDESREVAVRYGVMNVPTLMLFKDGAAIRTMIGAHPKEEILAFLGL